MHNISNYKLSLQVIKLLNGLHKSDLTIEYQWYCVYNVYKDAMFHFTFN